MKSSRVQRPQNIRKTTFRNAFRREESKRDQQIPMIVIALYLVARQTQLLFKFVTEMQSWSS
jgi:hypothetical protein